MKVLRVVTGAVLMFGLILIIGSVGQMDYYAEIGQFSLMSEPMGNVGVGALLMIPYFLISVIDDNFDIEIDINVYKKGR